MCTDYGLFLQAIHETKIVQLTFNSFEKGTITRRCVSYDYGPSRKYKDGLMRYHFYDLDSPDGHHNLSILANQIISIELLPENFDPCDYVTWPPSWFVKRDWGVHS